MRTKYLSHAAPLNVKYVNVLNGSKSEIKMSRFTHDVSVWESLSPEDHVTAVQRGAPPRGMVCSDADTPPTPSPPTQKAARVFGLSTVRMGRQAGGRHTL